MRWVVIGVVVLWWAVILVLILHLKAALPARPNTGNHGQGHSTDSRHCPPGTRAFYIYGDDGTTEYFLECMR